MTAAGLGLGPTGLSGMQEPAAAAGSGRRGVLPSCESPRLWEAMPTHVLPWVGSHRSYPLLRASRTSGPHPSPSETRRRPGGEQPSRCRRERIGTILPFSSPGCILPLAYPGRVACIPPDRGSCREHPGTGGLSTCGHGGEALARKQTGRQGQGGRRAALRSPNAHVRKWLHFSERKREVERPRRGSQQLPPLSSGAAVRVDCPESMN